MPKKSEVGRIGEDIACEFLKKKKYKILYRNKRWPWGELDIVARQSDGTLVFIEVKTLFNKGEDFTPEQNYSFDKNRKTQRAVKWFAGKYPSLINDELGFRIDLIAVKIKNTFLRDWHEDCEIRHYENV